MIPILTLAAVLLLGPEHRVADFRAGASSRHELVLAIDGNRVITYAPLEHTLRAVPVDQPEQATVIVSDVSDLSLPVVAPPLMSWTAGQETHIARIDAPGRGLVFPRADVGSMQCNAAACLAQPDNGLLVLGTDATLIARVNPGGTVLAADPDGFLVASFEARLPVKRIDNRGAVTFTTAPLAADTPWQLAADFDGSRYALFWSESDGITFSSLHAASIGLGGDATAPLTLATLRGWIGGIAVAHNGGRHLATFSFSEAFGVILLPGAIASERLLALRLTDALHAEDATPFVVNDTLWAEERPVVAPRQGGFLVAWSHSEGMIARFDPEAATVDANGKVSPRMLLSRGLVPQQAASAARTPSGLLITWLEWPQEDGNATLFARRFANDGKALAPAVAVTTGDAFRAAMAARGDEALIVWESRPALSGWHLEAAILHGDGTLQPVALPNLFGAPSVAASRNGWMIVVPQIDGVTAIRVDAGGAVSAPQAVVSAPFISPEATVASDGERFLVVWSSDAGFGSPLCNFTGCGTRAELLDATGGILAGGIQIAPKRVSPSAAFSGGEYFVAAGESGVRVSRDGARLGEADVTLGTFHVRLAPFGNGVLAAWPSTDGIHVVAIERGVGGKETLIGPAADSELALASNAIVYDVKASGSTATVFRILPPERRRAVR